MKTIFQTQGLITMVSVFFLFATTYYRSDNAYGGAIISIAVKNTRKPYITPQERKQQQRQILKKFCFELLLRQDERAKSKNK